MTPTDWFIIATIAVIAIYDVYLLRSRKHTISNRLRSAGRYVSALPASWGVLAGHFWGPDLPPLMGVWWLSIAMLIIVLAVLIPIHLFLRAEELIPDWFSVVYVPLYIPAGMYMWPQGM